MKVYCGETSGRSDDTAGKVPYTIYGVDAELVTWAITTDFAERALGVGGDAQVFRDKDDLHDTLLEFFGTDAHWQITKAEKLILRQWRRYPELGPYPGLLFLTDSQYKGVFYTGYRDHVAHQYKVFLLGLYLYDSLETVKQAVKQELREEKRRLEEEEKEKKKKKKKKTTEEEKKKRTTEREDRRSDQDLEDEFILRWHATALAHDIGYLFENNYWTYVMDNQPASKAYWKDLFTLLGDIMRRPLAHTLPSAQTLASPKREEEEEFTSILGAENDLPREADYSPDFSEPLSINNLAELPKIASLETRKRLFYHDLDATVQRAHPGLTRGARSKDVLAAYLDLTQRGQIDTDLPNYIDHGIAGAAILWRLWWQFNFCVLRIKQMSPTEAPTLAQRVLPFSDKLDEERIVAITSAIALHNLTFEHWQPAEIQKRKPLSLDHRLAMSFHPRSSVPMAYLLRISDELQNWDRPTFVAARGEGKGKTDRDMVIDARRGDEKIYVHLRSDTCFRDQHAKTNKNASLHKLICSVKSFSSDKGSVDALFEDLHQADARGPLALRPVSRKGNPIRVCPWSKRQGTKGQAANWIAIGQREEQLTARILRDCRLDQITRCADGRKTPRKCPVRLNSTSFAAEVYGCSSELCETVTLYRLLARIWKEASFFATTRRWNAAEMWGTLLDRMPRVERWSKDFESFLEGMMERPKRAEESKCESREERLEQLLNHRCGSLFSAEVAELAVTLPELAKRISETCQELDKTGADRESAYKELVQETIGDFQKVAVANAGVVLQALGSVIKRRFAGTEGIKGSFEKVDAEADNLPMAFKSAVEGMAEEAKPKGYWRG